jgi:hypothetical protein
MQAFNIEGSTRSTRRGGVSEKRIVPEAAIGVLGTYVMNV